jgi:phosphatidate cytidylyltransferase
VSVGLAGSLRRAASTAPNLTRFTSAAVLIPLALIPAVLGGEWFAGLVVGVAAAAAWELSTLQARAGQPTIAVLAVVTAIALPLAGAIHALAIGWLLFAAAVGVGLLALARTVAPPSPISSFALSLAAGLYPGALLTPAIALRERGDGLAWLLLILVGTWACDTAAFFVGRRWGHRKLAPTISPGKTVEGLAAGITAGLIVGAIASALLPGEVPARVVGLGLVVAIAAVVGDLTESVIKRRLGAKDSGWVVPGHGGLLDRIDSLLFSGFLGYLYIAVTDGVLYT